MSPFLKKVITNKEHYSNFWTFEIATLLNVPSHYLRKYGNYSHMLFYNHFDPNVDSAVCRYVGAKAHKHRLKIVSKKWILISFRALFFSNRLSTMVE